MAKIGGWLNGTIARLTKGAFPAFFMVVGIIALGLTAQAIIRKMDSLQTGRYDDSMWTVSQLEVDFHRFLLAAHSVVDAPPAARSDAIATLTRSFDIYYSRVGILLALTNSDGTSGRRLVPSPLAMARINAHLQELVPLIDNSAGQDPAYFQRILAVATPIASTVRQNTMDALQSIVRRDAQERADQASVLWWLLAMAEGTSVLLLGTAILVQRQSWQLRRRAADIARVSSNLTKAIETSLDAVIITDVAGRISTYNTAAENMFGRSAAEMTGGSLQTMLQHGHEIADCLAGSANRGRVQVTLKKGDGSDITVEAAIASDVDIDGKPIFLSHLRDVSQLVAADAKERAARFEAERRAAANARFLAVMSHEIRTPLHGIIASLELLDRITTSDQGRLLQKITRDCAGTALEQIEEVLELSLHNAADVPGVVLTFFPIEVARLVVDQSQSLASANQTTLTLDYDPAATGPMLGNRRAFRSALANLVGNAIKFTRNGTITVRVFPTPDMADTLRVEVQDTGIGIERQHMSRIFDDFETVADPMLHAIGVSGLGLGIVRRAVALMGGTLQVESIFGQGSRFRFDIPQNATPLPPVAEIEAASDTSLSVLVVDDNAVNRMLLAQMLNRLGHSVELADDGAVAVRSAHQRQFDLILMDINMPGMDGVEATRLIRTGGASATVPIMGVTANAQPQDLARFMAAGMISLLIKPVTHAALVMQLRELAYLQESRPPQDTLPPLIALENLRDLQAAMRWDDILVIARTALHDATTALARAVQAPSDPSLADHIHHAAGSAALIGAQRLHHLLCKIEDAARAGQGQGVAGLLAAADTARQDTIRWFDSASAPL